MIICFNFRTSTGCGAENPSGAQRCYQCGQFLRFALELHDPGALVSHFRIIHLLGHGMSGAVYEAEDTQKVNTHVAIKETFDSASIHSFQGEFTALSQLRHLHLPRYDAMFEAHSNGYLVMEYVPGQSLDDILQSRQGPLVETQVLDYAIQLCDVLTYLHGQHLPILHRDIKPANIRLTPEGLIKLVDFGLLKQGTGSTRSSRLGLTPAYAPIEQYGGRGSRTDPRSDIYSLGATLYHLLTGQEPLLATDRIASSPDPLVPPQQYNPNLSPYVANAVVTAMSLRQNDRFPNAATFKDALISGGQAGDKNTVAPLLHSEPLDVVNIHATSREEPSGSLEKPIYQAFLPMWLLATVVMVVALVLLVNWGRGWLAVRPSAFTNSATAISELPTERKPSTNLTVTTREAKLSTATNPILANTTIKTTPTLGPSGSDMPTELIITPTEPIMTSTPAATTLPPTILSLPTVQTLSPLPSVPIFPPSSTLAPTTAIPTVASQQTLLPSPITAVPATITPTNTSTPNPTPTPLNLPTSTSTPASIAALLAYRCKPTDYTNDQICVRRANGPDQPPLTHDPVYAAAYPAWSPDGRRIAFVWNRSGKQDIWVMDADGNNPCNLTGLNFPGGGTNCPSPQNSPELLNLPENHPAWSPDGNRIAFIASTNPITSTYVGDIWVMNANGTNPRNLTNSPSVSELNPTWSPDGSKIAFASAPLTNIGDFHIWVMDANGTNPRDLTIGKFPLATQATEMTPAWSPNGVWIAFICVNDTLGRGRLDKDICVISPDGNNPVQWVTRRDPDDADPAWSPDSTQIVFILSKKIQAIKVDGTDRYDFWHQHSPQGEVEPAWSPNAASASSN